MNERFLATLFSPSYVPGHFRVLWPEPWCSPRIIKPLTLHNFCFMFKPLFLPLSTFLSPTFISFHIPHFSIHGPQQILFDHLFSFPF